MDMNIASVNFWFGTQVSVLAKESKAAQRCMIIFVAVTSSPL